MAKNQSKEQISGIWKGKFYITFTEPFDIKICIKHYKKGQYLTYNFNMEYFFHASFKSAWKADFF